MIAYNPYVTIAQRNVYMLLHSTCRWWWFNILGHVQYGPAACAAKLQQQQRPHELIVFRAM